MQRCSCDQGNASHFLSLSTTQCLPLKRSDQSALFPLHAYWLWCMAAWALFVHYPAPAPPLQLWKALRLDLVPLQCFLEMLWSVILRAAQNSRLLQLLSAPQWLSGCVKLCFLIFSVFAYSHRSKPCSHVLCFQPITVIVGTISHLISRWRCPLTSTTFHPQPFLLHRFSFWGVTRRFCVRSCASAQTQIQHRLCHSWGSATVVPYYPPLNVLLSPLVVREIND